MVGGFAFLGSFPRVGFCVVLTWESWVNVYDDDDTCSAFVWAVNDSSLFRLYTPEFPNPILTMSR
jgi:hypothetical protein